MNLFLSVRPLLISGGDYTGIVNRKDCRLQFKQYTEASSASTEFGRLMIFV